MIAARGVGSSAGGGGQQPPQYARTVEVATVDTTGPARATCSERALGAALGGGEGGGDECMRGGLPC